MSDIKKILVAEDELTSSILLKRLLTKAGYSVAAAYNGNDALAQMEKENFDALLTDWMMPQMDGIELIRRVRQKIKPVPLIMMITALVSEGARNYALESGADDYIAKPIDVEDLISRVKDGLLRKEQEIIISTSGIVKPATEPKPPFVGVVVATSTGGPPALLELFKNVKPGLNAAFYIVQHGPQWMIETFADRLQKETSFNVSVAAQLKESQAGSIYIAPGDKHLRVESKTFRLLLDDGPKENFVRPSADPLFRSAADAFGKNLVAVVLTGLGKDGAQGAAHVVSSGGRLLVQDPETAVAPSMPRTLIESGVKHKMVALNDMGKSITDTLLVLQDKLSRS